MKTLRTIPDLAHLRGPLSLGIGVFDGVHLGHQAVIAATLEAARENGGTSVIVTFDPHPARVLRPENPPRLLTSTQHKLQLLASLGVETVLIVPFDLPFASQSPEKFITELAPHADSVHTICVGEDWSFGKNRTGNVAFLRELGQRLNFHVTAVAPVQIDGVTASSTRIRQAIESGDFALAATYLGRPYTILGTVGGGRKLGRSIGFPTANLSAHNEQFPPNGVYAVEAFWQGKKLPAVANIGVRPSIENALPGRLLEVHLLDFAEDLYGQDLEISFLHFIRAEEKFESLDALKAQIARDTQTSRDFFRNRG